MQSTIAAHARLALVTQHHQSDKEDGTTGK